jgi:hypothetical protein
MSEACPGATDDGLLRPNAGASQAAAWLSLAAAPTFAIMGLATVVLDERAPAILCVHDASPLGGMAPMYWLMAVFHAAPWLKFIFRA